MPSTATADTTTTTTDTPATTSNDEPLTLDHVPVDDNALNLLLDGDSDAVELLAVFVPTSQTERALLQALADKSRQGLLSGSKGHQRDEDVAHQFATPAVHWLGAADVGDQIVFRGVVDQSADDVKRWVRSGRLVADGWRSGRAMSLDLMAPSAAPRGGKLIVGRKATTSEMATISARRATGEVHGTSGTSGTSSTSSTTSGSAGEIHGTSSNVMDGLHKRTKSIIPGNQRGGVYVTPPGYSNGTEQSSASAVGLPVRRRSI